SSTENIILKTNFSHFWFARITSQNCIKNESYDYIFPNRFEKNYIYFDLEKYKNCNAEVDIIYFAAFIKWFSFFLSILMMLICLIIMNKRLLRLK
ncbi:hypothetical protein OAM56_01880, partial [Alphaproteobacteria bacterium]|nr:hypothetical protein [Alphaproteobacteria bacterium]